MLAKYCADCHADGEAKGGIAFDTFKSDADLAGNHELWLKVVKNLRTNLMPPAKKEKPSAEEVKRLENWVKYDAFGINPTDPDPGRVTVRRLNRIEYRNTVRDLLGVDYNTDVEFPPDDTGYGFDDIGDVLTLSPMLLEKYLTAAKAIVTEAVPTVSRVIPETVLAGSRFRLGESKAPRNGGRGGRDAMLSMSYYEPATASLSHTVEHAGTYHVVLDLAVRGNFDFDPGRCQISFKMAGKELLQKEFGWYDNKTFRFDFEQKLEAGDSQLTFELKPLVPVDKRINSLDIRLVSVTLRGPGEEKYQVRPRNYDRFFAKPVPAASADKKAYAAEILNGFTRKAFRRPVDKATVERYVKLAESVYKQPGKNFETGIFQAMIAVLASPRFLFRLEEIQPESSGKSRYGLLDEYSLASRLSYLLWSTTPDETLLDLAAKGQLRQELTHQVKRMLEDPRSEQMVQNFTGQWLQTRDVESISINARAVLARDNNTTNQVRGFGNRSKPALELDRELRTAMEKETTMLASSIVHEDRSITEFLDCDYAFLNEKLAKAYGMTNLDITGSEMRRVSLPTNSPRGGVLTAGSVLVVTSNPDRTSPVKRGLFILDNVLGTPSPPPPANVPALEAAEKDFKDHQPTLREALKLHREKPLCASCHNRMDPIGLAFENFNALGMWREKERGQTIEAGGKLVTGENFDTVRELKHILITEHRMDFYRCLTSKFLTYALGRGPEYYDLETIDRIVNRLDQEKGKFSALLYGVIESAPFQKQRTKATEVAAIAPAIPVSATSTTDKAAGKQLSKP